MRHPHEFDSLLRLILQWEAGLILGSPYPVWAEGHVLIKE